MCILSLSLSLSLSFLKKAGKRSHGMDKQQKDLWYGLANLDNRMPENVQKIINFIAKAIDNWKVE